MSETGGFIAPPTAPPMGRGGGVSSEYVMLAGLGRGGELHLQERGVKNLMIKFLNT